MFATGRTPPFPACSGATRLSPRFTLAHLHRASINAALGRADVAFASLERARAIEPESWTVLYDRGAVAAALGMHAEAIKHFEAALALEPERKGLRNELAWEYWAVKARNLNRPPPEGVLNGGGWQAGDTAPVRR